MNVEYMSQEGYDKIVEELRQLMEVDLPQAKESLKEAREKGDLSENFEYHAAKREHGRILSRIRFRQRVLQYARVIDTSAMSTDTIHLLSRVELTNLATNARLTYTITNPHEANLREGKISIKSPLVQGLMGKKVGEIVDIQVPAGVLHLRIESISV